MASAPSCPAGAAEVASLCLALAGAAVAGSASGSWFGPAPGCRAQSGHSIPRVATPGGDRTGIVPPRRRHPRASIALLPRTVRMSSSSHASDTSITGPDPLVGYVASGEKPRADRRLGTEQEQFGFRLAYLRPPAFDGERRIRPPLWGLARFTSSERRVGERGVRQWR